MGVYQDAVRKLTSDPGARWLAGVTDELAGKVAALQQALDACCGGDSLGVRALADMEKKHDALAESHTRLLAEHQALSQAHEALSVKYSEQNKATPSAAPSPEPPK